MESIRVKKRGASAIFSLCPGRLIIVLLSTVGIALHLLLRKNHGLMSRLSEGFIRPVHRAMAELASNVPFSVAELLIYLASSGVLVYIIYSIIRIISGGEGWDGVYRILMTLLSAGLGIYALFCMMWGIYYYADDFCTKSGIDAEAVSAVQLEIVTEYFAELTNYYAPMVDRSDSGVCATDRVEILEKSVELYDKAEELFPCLEGPRVRAKAVMFSRGMSYIDFTGFFFPFTGEANVNTDFPPSLFASTVAHELAHQRGVAKEQEANFAAVLASLEYGDADYCYSACLLAYTHLSNALYGADRDACRRIQSGLCPEVLADFAANRQYWARFDTPVQTVSNTVYEGFLQSYDQTLGLKSYGACVDLLVNYYYDAALEYLGKE